MTNEEVQPGLIAWCIYGQGGVQKCEIKGWPRPSPWSPRSPDLTHVMVRPYDHARNEWYPKNRCEFIRTLRLEP